MQTVFYYGTGATLSVVTIFAATVLMRKSRNPEKTLWNCFLSVCLTPLRLVKLGPYKKPVSLETACQVAMDVTGLKDFGDTKFFENYAVVTAGAVQKSLRYHNIGYIMGQMELNMTMTRKLRLVQYLKDSPDVMTIGVNKPVFVVGLPRTGTTFLHRLLSLDPTVRAPLLWELLNPVPNVTVKNGAQKADFIADLKVRAEEVRKQVKTRQEAGDRALEHIHEIAWDIPEECLIGMSDVMPCLTQYFYSMYVNFPEYRQKVGYAEVVDTYRRYKQILQLLAYQVGDFKSQYRWMLKSPIHLFYIKELAAVFPDATIIWTHRHPVSAVPSLCSLLQAIHKIYFDPATHDSAALGGAVRDLSAQLLEQTPRDIAESGLAHADVVYDTFVKDPVGTVRALYQQLGWHFSAEYEAILREHLLQDKQKRDQVKARKSGGAEVLHSYAPEEFNLTAADLTNAPQFATYIKNFNIPPVKA